MVNNDKNLPEPPTTMDDNLATNDEIIPPTDSDTDEEENTYGGYDLLHLSSPDNPNEVSDNEEHEQISEEGTVGGCSSPVIEIESALVWSAPRVSGDINMDSNKVDEVKQAMLNITLPSSAIPEWASNIPEDDWKQHLINRITDLQK